MKRVVAVLLGLQVVTASAAVSAPSADRPGRQAPRIEIFTNPDCPHCHRALEYLEQLAREHPDLRVIVHDVVADSAAAGRLIRLARREGVSRLGVPAFYVADRLIIGFDDAETTGRMLESLLGLGTLGRGPPDTAAAPDAIDAPLIGTVSAGKLGLPVFTFVIGLIDGFNPCAMWALLYLLSLLVNLRDRVKMFAIAGTFVLVGGLIYFAFIAAWLELFLFIGLSRAVQLTLAGVAIAIGAVNVKDFVAFRRGPTLSIPEAAKPTIYARMRRVLTAEDLLGAVVAVAVLAGLINLVELLCTAGLPAIYTEILAANQLPRGSHYAYLGLYIIAYILDDSIVLTIAVVTLGRRKMQEREGRVLKLISGAVMLLLGIALIVKPGWLF